MRTPHTPHPAPQRGCRPRTQQWAFSWLCHKGVSKGLDSCVRLFLPTWKRPGEKCQSCVCVCARACVCVHTGAGANVCINTAVLAHYRMHARLPTCCLRLSKGDSRRASLRRRDPCACVCVCVHTAGWVTEWLYACARFACVPAHWPGAGRSLGPDSQQRIPASPGAALPQAAARHQPCG